MDENHRNSRRRIKTIYDRWVKPELGLADEYGPGWVRPVGNSAEMMPMDNHLNQDVHEGIRTQVIVSMSILPDDPKDPRLFSLATPKLVASAYKRAYDPETGVSPRPERIVEDVTRFIHACKEIHKAKGVYVPGLAGGRTPGYRHKSTTEKTSNNHGGRRKRKDYDHEANESHIHPDLRDLMNESRGVSALFDVGEESHDEDP